MTREEALEFIAQSVKSDVDMAKVADALKALEQEPTIEEEYEYVYIGNGVYEKRYKPKTEAAEREEAIKQCEEFIKNHSDWSVEVEWANGVEFVLEDYKRLIKWESRMNKEKAIEILKADSIAGYSAEDVISARDMAIKALEQEPISLKYCDRNICINNEYNNIGCEDCEVTKSQEPTNNDLVPRKVVERIIKSPRTQEQMLSMLNSIQAVTPQEPKTGEWIDCDNSDDYSADGYDCSVCGVNAEYATSYCPNCGARMVEPQERSDKDADKKCTYKETGCGSCKRQLDCPIEADKAESEK